MKLNAKQKLVLDVIKANPGVENDEALLISKVWERENWNSSCSLYENLKHVTHPETISRRRRELFNMGLITYTKEALSTRTKAFINERDMHSKGLSI